jgi:hypothetical protein
MTAPADRAHAILIAHDHHSVAIVFDLVNPVGTVGYFVGFGRKGKRKHAGHISVSARLTHLPFLVACFPVSAINLRGAHRLMGMTVILVGAAIVTWMIYGYFW